MILVGIAILLNIAAVAGKCGQCKHCLHKDDCLLNVITVWSNNGVVDWQRVLEENSEFDPRFEENFRNMDAIGMLHRGAYHYFKGEPGSASADAQLQNFMNTITQAGFDEKKDFAVVNVEIFKNEGSDKNAFTEKLVNYVTLLKSKVPNVVIHANSDQWATLVNTEHDDFFAQFPLSVIDYNNVQSPTLPRPWTTWQRWLYTKEVPVNGISGPVWLSRVNCSVKMMPCIF
uniref:Lysozyme n=1 Tax=Globodera rostochiensis TaxID=31243 RepID=A0A914I160_GLORO